MTRSMALIRLYFVGVIKNLSQEVGRRLADQVRALIYRSISFSPSLTPCSPYQKQPHKPLFTPNSYLYPLHFGPYWRNWNSVSPQIPMSSGHFS